MFDCDKYALIQTFQNMAVMVENLLFKYQEVSPVFSVKYLEIIDDLKSDTLASTVENWTRILASDFEFVKKLVS